MSAEVGAIPGLGKVILPRTLGFLFPRPLLWLTALWQELIAKAGSIDRYYKSFQMSKDLSSSRWKLSPLSLQGSLEYRLFPRCSKGSGTRSNHVLFSLCPWCFSYAICFCASFPAHLGKKDKSHVPYWFCRLLIIRKGLCQVVF